MIRQPRAGHSLNLRYLSTFPPIAFLNYVVVRGEANICNGGCGDYARSSSGNAEEGPKQEERSQEEISPGLVFTMLRFGVYV